MITVHCADCGTGCAVLYGREVDPQDRDIADAQVWACPSCPCAWAVHDPATDRPVGAPAGFKTRDARRQVAARIAARIAAGVAAGVAAWDAAKAKLEPTRLELQRAALALVERMLELRDAA